MNDPDDMDGIHKDYVFKLQFKNHVYFFRAESEYTFERQVHTFSSLMFSQYEFFSSEYIWKYCVDTIYYLRGGLYERPTLPIIGQLCNRHTSTV